jgi:hypothetical protein
VHSGASEVRNIDTLFFMLRWDPYGFHKKCVETCYAELMFLHPVASMGHVLHFCASGTRNINALFFTVGWDRYGFLKKARGDTLRRTCTFASSGICGSHSVFRCVRGMKRRCTIFHAWVGPIHIPPKARRDTLHRTCVLHPVGSVGHVVHSSTSDSAFR